MTLALRQTDVVLDDSGYPVVNGYFYVGTYQTDPVANPISLFSDVGLTVPIANPQRTDSYGRPENDIYISFSRYSYLIKNSAGTTIEGPKDRVPFGNASQVALDQGGSVQDAIDWVTPEMFGAAGDGVTDDAAAFNAATSYLNGRNGILLCGAKEYVVGSTILMYTGVVVVGQGSKSTTIKLADGADVDVFRTWNYATLTGTTAWKVSAGVPVRFGWYGLSIDGNKANNTLGNGAVVFGKGYMFDDFVIHDCAEWGFKTECGSNGGQDSWEDMPEMQGHYLGVFRCDGGCVEYDGPHDGHIDTLITSGGPEGIVCTDTVDVTFAHCYGHQGDGVRLASRSRWGVLIAESCNQSGLGSANLNVTGEGVQIGTLLAYSADVGVDVLISGNNCSVESLRVNGNRDGIPALQIGGSGFSCQNIMLVNSVDNTTAPAMIVGTTRILAKGQAVGASGVTGWRHGVVFGQWSAGTVSAPAATLTGLDIDMHVYGAQDASVVRATGAGNYKRNRLKFFVNYSAAGGAQGLAYGSTSPFTEGFQRGDSEQIETLGFDGVAPYKPTYGNIKEFGSVITATSNTASGSEFVSNGGTDTIHTVTDDGAAMLVSAVTATGSNRAVAIVVRGSAATTAYSIGATAGTAIAVSGDSIQIANTTGSGQTYLWSVARIR